MVTMPDWTIRGIIAIFTTFFFRRIAAEIEGAVRRTPHQWFVFRELWPGIEPVSR